VLLLFHPFLKTIFLPTKSSRTSQLNSSGCSGSILSLHQRYASVKAEAATTPRGNTSYTLSFISVKFLYS